MPLMRSCLHQECPTLTQKPCSQSFMHGWSLGGCWYTILLRCVAPILKTTLLNQTCSHMLSATTIAVPSCYRSWYRRWMLVTWNVRIYLTKCSASPMQQKHQVWSMLKESCLAGTLQPFAHIDASASWRQGLWGPSITLPLVQGWSRLLGSSRIPRHPGMPKIVHEHSQIRFSCKAVHDEKSLLMISTALVCVKPIHGDIMGFCLMTRNQEQCRECVWRFSRWVWATLSRKLPNFCLRLGTRCILSKRFIPHYTAVFLDCAYNCQRCQTAHDLVSQFLMHRWKELLRTCLAKLSHLMHMLTKVGN